MAKKNFNAAADAQLEQMSASVAQRMLESAKETTKQKEKNDKPFTIWTTPENVNRWKAYQKAKKASIPTQAALFEIAVNEYISAHPVTEEEKAALLSTLGF